jgi:hypothetical protein
MGKTMALPTLVLIEWEDSSQALPQWQLMEDLEVPGVARCFSAGFLVKDTKTEKGLALSLANPGTESFQAAAVISIPAGCIKSTTKLTSSCLRRLCGRDAASRPKRRRI